MLSNVQHPLPSHSSWYNTTDELLRRVQNNARDDMWEYLLTLADHSNTTTKQSLQIYEAALKCFPNTPAIQVAHLRRALCQDSDYAPEQVLALFRKYLEYPSVAVCALYVSFIKEHSFMIPTPDIHEFVLNLVGQEYESHGLWTQYLNTLEEVGDQTLRRALVDAVKIPTKDLPQFWIRLQRLSQQDSSDTMHLLPLHKRALLVRHQIQHYAETLYPVTKPGVTQSNHSDTLLLPASPVASSFSGHLARRWEAYLRWEESDPLRLRDNDMGAYRRRLGSAYLRATIRVRFCPEIWYMEYRWRIGIGTDEEAIARLREGIEANKASTLLNFALADALEAKGHANQVKKIYEDLLIILRTTLNSGADAGYACVSKDLGVVYKMYMRFAFRTRNVTATRSLLAQATKDGPLVPWLVYAEAAKSQLDCEGSKDVALQIFHAGMTNFSKDIQFVICYLEWLIAIDARKHAEALVNSTVFKLPPKDAAYIRDRWLRYIYHGDDLQSIQGVEQDSEH
ncbi:mRNA 3'-end-processing protein rna14 [Paramarasmius palmivorus]|uniref:mRNA 3'-end-processing protein RNA14 n=1 Tax=Paramarasmius palmivorus TaxID=297713 RepID=A0AAW0BWU1_9AGAR